MLIRDLDRKAGLPGRLLSVLILGLSYSTGLFAGNQVSIDHLVTTSAGPMIVGQTAKSYSSQVVVTNISTQEILSPVRVIVTSIDREKVSVVNADGFSGGDPYVEIEFAGTLGKSDSVTAQILFEREAGKSTPGSKGNGKTKNRNFPTFDFSTSVTGGSSVAPQAPTSFPYALSTTAGVVPVVFNVGLLTEGGTVDSVFLRNLAEPGPGTQMNDAGADGDQIAGDDIYSVTLQVNGGALAAGQCLSYVGVTHSGGEQNISSVYKLCATSFPTRVAVSNTDPSNVITLPGENIVVADEIVIVFRKGTSEADISALVASIGGEVVGTILRFNEYQVKLAVPRTPSQLEQLISQLNKNKLVFIAAPNGLVAPSASANDTEFVNQRGLKATHVDDAWDIGATGAGITVIVLDEGVDAAHLDFAAGTVVAGGANTDATGHGTQMAGIIAAEADNARDIAGIAHDALIRSLFVDITTDTGFKQGFLDAATVAGSIVNVSLNRISPAGHVPNLCESINTTIEGMTGKVVVNSAGNNSSDGAWWPGRCNSASTDADRIAFFGAAPSDIVVNKARFIVVSATNCNADECAADTHLGSSNFGDWVDVAAPGNAVPTLQTTSLGGSTTTITGTSAAAAIVSAAAANLRGCGVGINGVETALTSDTPGSSLVQVPYAGTSPGNTPRVDMVTALETVNTAPTGVGPSNFSIDENTDTSGGTSLGTLATTDSNACDLHAYTIVAGGDAASFSIGGSANDELILTAGTLNFEAKSSYTVTVESTDYFGAGPAGQLITVTVNDLNEPPTIAPQARSIDENKPFGTNVGAPIVASDPDAGATWTFAITGGNTGGAFAISPAGQITVANQAALDFETNPVFNLTVEVTDNGSLTDSATITVTLNDVFEPIPNPILVFDTFIDYETDPGQFFRRWEFNVTNFAAFPAELFVQTADYGPCGLNATPSRSWVDYFDAGPDGLANTGDDVRLFGFCALGNPASMNGTWFARPRPGGTGAAVPPPPAGVYMKIIDRATSAEYISNVVTGLPNPSIP